MNEQQLDFFGGESEETRKIGLSTGERVDQELVNMAKAMLAAKGSLRAVRRKTGLAIGTVVAIRNGMSLEEIDTLKNNHLRSLMDIAAGCEEVMMEKLCTGNVSFRDAAIGLGIVLQRSHDLSGAANVHHVVHHTGEGMESAEAWLQQRLERPVMGREVGEDEDKRGAETGLTLGVNVATNDIESAADQVESLINQGFACDDCGYSSDKPGKEAEKTPEKTQPGGGGRGGPRRRILLYIEAFKIFISYESSTYSHRPHLRGNRRQA